MVGKSGRRQSHIPDFSARPGGSPPRRGKIQDGGSRRPNVETEEEVGDGAAPSTVPIAAVEDIRRMVGDMVGTVTQLTARLDTIVTDAAANVGRVAAVETRVSDVEDSMQPLLQRIEALEKQVREANLRLEDQEGRARRSNVRILGLPEGQEGPRPSQFLEELVKKVLPDAQLSPVFLVERAHRALQAKPPPGASPRPMIAKILNFRDRDAILAAARALGTVRHQGHVLSFYPDYTQMVQGLRKQFMQVKAALRARKITYSIMHPAKLRFIHANKAHFFTDPTKAMEYVEARILAPSRETGSRVSSQHGSPAGQSNAGRRGRDCLAALEAVAQVTGKSNARGSGSSIGSSRSSVATPSDVIGADSIGAIGDWILDTPPPLLHRLDVAGSAMESQSALGDND